VKFLLKKLKGKKKEIKQYYESEKEVLTNSKRKKFSKRTKSIEDNPQKSQVQDKIGDGGSYIRLGHVKFDLILNIMIGIKKSISNLFEIPFMGLSDK